MSLMVGIHGISPKPLNRKEMETTWRQNLEDGLQVAHGRPVTPPTLSLVFFDDLVMAPVTSAVKGPADLKTGIESLDAEELSEFEATARELLTPEERAEAKALPPDKAITWVPGPLATLMAALDRHFGAAAVALLIWEFKQVRRYLRDRAIKAEVDRRVCEKVTVDSRVLFGHSLGSVVAFEFLRENTKHQVGLLLTAGSPLGLRMVRERMADVGYGSQSSWGVPGNIGHWVNLRDLHDPVACAGDLSEWWPGVIDRHVVNGGDTHSVDRYLAQKYAGQAILAAIPELTQ